MTAKRITFDEMPLGKRDDSDTISLEQYRPSRLFQVETKMDSFMLKQKLRQEAANILPGFFIKDPDSSSNESSDDCDFPESLQERAQRLSFARRRRLHYQEFATVAKARRLINEEFGGMSVSDESDEIDEVLASEECSVCEEHTSDTIPYLQYNPSMSLSQHSDESLMKDEPEPGFRPSHHCFGKLTGAPTTRNSVRSTSRVEQQTETHNDIDSQPESNPFIHPAIHDDLNDLNVVPRDEELSGSVIERSEFRKHTIVLDKGEQWDL
ncbi:hypothetical protein KR009_008642, partial [Drosophila setifemur]